MKKLIIAGCLLLVPIIGSGSIVVNAPAQDGGWAYLYNPDNGSVYDQQQFSGGTATLDTTGLTPGSSKYAVDMTYDAAKVWKSRVYWEQSPNNYAVGDVWNGANKTITAVTGEITSRSYVTNSGARQLSVTYNATTGGAVDLQDLNDDISSLDAYLRVYRPTTLAEMYSPDMVKTWNPDDLPTGYTLVVSDTADAAYKQLTIWANAGSFYAEFVGQTNGSLYDVGYAAFDDPGDTAYWTTFDLNGSDNGVSNNLDGSVTFTAQSASTDALENFVPYYVYMDYSQVFDDFTDPASLIRGFDGGDGTDALVSYEYYAIPEPGVIVIMLGSAGLLFGWRRMFSV